MRRGAGRDLMAALDGNSGEHPEAWIPDVNESLVGELIEYREAQAKHGPARIAVIREDSGLQDRAVWLFHKVLLEEFKRLQPKPGERVGIRRLEDGQTGDFTYRRFTVVVDREGDSEVPDFDGLETVDPMASPHPGDQVD